MNKLNKKEIIFILGVSIIMIVIALIPYFYCYFIKQDQYFTHLIYFPDTSVYLSYIDQIKAGNFLADDLFTNEANFNRTFNPFWLLVGLTARIFNLSAITAFHLFRVILTPIFLFVLYKFISLFISQYSVMRKKLCFLYAIFASGIGFLELMLWGIGQMQEDKINLALDVWIIDISNFKILLSYPHYIASLTLILLIFYYFYLAIDQQKLKYGALAGFLALALFSFHVYFVITIYLVALLYLIFIFIKNKSINKKAIINFLLLVAISLPAVLYYFYLLLFDWFFAGKALQNVCATPGGWHFFLGLGFGLIFALLAIVIIIKQKKLNNKNIFLITWLAVSIILIYSPISFQRRLAEGLQIPLVILSFWGLVFIADFLKRKYATFKDVYLLGFLPVFILLFCFTNFVVYANNFIFLSQKPDIIFVDQAEKDALDWYQEQTGYQQTILSSDVNGNIIVGLITRRVYIGHPDETLNYDYKEQKTKWFFADNNNDLDKKNFLAAKKIDYIYYAAEEKKLGGFSPNDKEYLESVFANEKAEIYKVNLDLAGQ